MTEYERTIKGPLVRCFADPWRCDTISLYVHWKRGDGRCRLEPKNAPLMQDECPEFHWVEVTARSRLPAFDLSPEAAQELMNSLWDCGIRPVQGKGSAGQLDATLRHLEDMRQIAFGKLEIDKP